MSTIVNTSLRNIITNKIQPPVRCKPYGRMNRQCKCVNQKDEHDSPYDMNRNKLVESRNKRGNESKRNVGVY